MPAPVLHAMREATTAGDIDRLHELLPDVEREAGASVASALRALADGFDLAAIQRALSSDAAAVSQGVAELSSTTGGAA
jgi:hypothetical protein